MSFIPDMSQWVRDRMGFVPRETAAFCGDLSGLHILDVGCGDMIADVGLLSLNPRQITGLDVIAASHNVVEIAARAVAQEGFEVPTDYASRLRYFAYDGGKFPFPDNHFDLVYCWGSFEHVSNVPAVLQEMRRVVTPQGRIFIVVYPWFHCYDGSHLSDFIDEPFFHLSRPKDWVHARLKEYETAHPNGVPVLERLWPEYCTLNQYSARMFLSDAMKVGLYPDRLQCHVDEKHVADVPSHVDIVDVVSAGTTVIFRADKPRLEKAGEVVKLREEVRQMRSDLVDAIRQRNGALQELSSVRSSLEQELKAMRGDLEAERAVRRGVERSISWRLTAPGRSVMSYMRKGPRVS